MQPNATAQKKRRQAVKLEALNIKDYKFSNKNDEQRFPACIAVPKWHCLFSSSASNIHYLNNETLLSNTTAATHAATTNVKTSIINLFTFYLKTNLY